MPVHHRPGNLPALFKGHPSRIYDFMARRVFRRLYRRIAQDVTASAPHGAKMLDVGTGPGILLAEVARLRPDLDLVGIDLSPDMVTVAERNLAPYGAKVSLHAADVTSLPFPQESFDVIVSSLSMHHWDHPQAAAPELARVLRPEGRIHIYDFRFAPFSALTGIRSSQPESSVFRTGVPFFPRFIKYVVA